MWTIWRTVVTSLVASLLYWGPFYFFILFLPPLKLYNYIGIHYTDSAAFALLYIYLCFLLARYSSIYRHRWERIALWIVSYGILRAHSAIGNQFVLEMGSVLVFGIGKTTIACFWGFAQTNPDPIPKPKHCTSLVNFNAKKSYCRG